MQTKLFSPHLSTLTMCLSIAWLGGCGTSSTTEIQPASNSTSHVSQELPDSYQTMPVAVAKEESSSADPGDWTYWRGPEFNGHSQATGLIDNWNPRGGSGSNVAWQREDLGGRSTPVVMDGRLYTLTRSEPESHREGEKVVCIDAKTGDTLWENRFNVYLSDVPDTRVGWSSVVGDPETGTIFAQGVCGHFQCIDAKTGKTKWTIRLHERFGLLSTYGGRTNFPIICDDLVIISAIVIGWGEMAKPAHRFIGLDKRTGKVVWFNGTRPLPYDTTYSGPTLTVLNQQKTLVFGSGDGAVWGLQPRTGKHIFQYRLSRRGLNAPPLVAGNMVFAGNGEENLVGTSMGAIVAFDATKPGDITDTQAKWQIDQLMAGRAQPLLINGRLWVFDDRAKLFIYNAETGEQIGRRIALGTMMRSSPLYADGKVYAATANGRWYILTPDEQRGAKILKKGRFPSGQESHASIICAQGRIYFQTTGSLYCVMDASKQQGFGKLPQPPAEPEVAANPTPTQVQLVPADALLRPGEKAEFEVRLFNSQGQFVGTSSDATFEVEGPGAVDSNGFFQAGPEAAHQASIVRVKVGQMTGEARIRNVPPLPWHFDFQDIAIAQGKGEPPITWVGCRYRHIVRDEGGNKVMVKITTIPKGARSRCWMGQSDLHDYTIQADVRGAISNNKMPDIGLIAQGYAIDLQGADQSLQIRSWVTQRRMAKTIAFPWKPDTWYTMKFQASNVGDLAILRGKVWPKGQPEPKEWSLLAEDESPNRSGSPGLFGNAKDAEIALDNISVVPN